MSKLLVNIRGCNGSGKSTIPISMMDDPDMYIVEKPYKGKSKRILTVFPSYGWVALGSYLNKTGGLDTFPNNTFIQKVMWYALKKYPEYDILMEGIIASTIRSTYIDLFQKVEKKYKDRKVVVIHFSTPPEVCIERVKRRNGGKLFREDLVHQKWGMVNRGIPHFKSAGFIVKSIDNSNTNKDCMLKKFLKLTEKLKCKGE